MALRRGFQAVRIDRDDALFRAPEERAGDPALVPFVADDNLDQAGEVLRGAGFRFGDAQAALFGDHRGVDLIDPRADLFEQPRKNRLSDRAHVEVGHLAAVIDLNLADRLVEELGLEVAQFGAQCQVRPHRFERFGRDRRDVDRARDRAREQEVSNRLGDRDGDRLLRLMRRGAEVRRDDHFVQPEQRIVRRHGLLLEDVERGARELARFYRVVKRPLVDQPAARRIDDAHAVLHLGEGRRADDAARLFGKRRMNGDEIGPLEDFVQRAQLNAGAHGHVLGDERVVSDDLHRQTQGARGDDLADVAQADYAQSLPGELRAHEALLVPFAGLELRMRLRDFARQRHHQRDGVFGRGHTVAAGGVHHDYAARGRGGNVNVVHARAGAAYDFELVGGADDLGGDFGFAADDQGVVTADDLFQLFQLQTRVDVNLKLLGRSEQVHADFGKVIADQNFHGV